MWTIAGGILLALFILAVLPFLGELLGAILGAIFGIGLVIALIWLAIDNFMFVMVASAIVCACYMYFKYKGNGKSENGSSVDALNLFQQLEVNKKLSEIYENKGKLLLCETNNKKNEIVRQIVLPNFRINISFDFGENKYLMNFKKRSELTTKTETYDGTLNWLPEKLSVDDIFLLDSELSSYINKKMNDDIESGKLNVSTGTGFFEDAKRFEKRDINVSIFQHLITQKGVKAIRPVSCSGQIDAQIKIDYNDAKVIVLIDKERVAYIDAYKWNELRITGKIKFSTEI